VNIFIKCLVIQYQIHAALNQNNFTSIPVQFRYLQLIRPGDGEEYNKNNFNDFHASKFKFIILTKNPFPEEHLLNITYPIKVVLAS